MHVGPGTLASAVKVTSPCSESPPSTAPSGMVTAPTQGGGAGGLIVSDAESEFAEVAVIVAVVVEDTGVVLTGKLAVVAPEATTTEGGVVAAGLLLARFTSTPEPGAGALTVTVPVALDPPVTEGGAMVRPVIVPVVGPFGLIVRPADTVLPEVAVMVAVV